MGDWLLEEDWLEEEAVAKVEEEAEAEIEENWLGEEVEVDIEEEVEVDIGEEVEAEVEEETGAEVEALIGAWHLHWGSRLRGCFRGDFHGRLLHLLLLLHSVQTFLFAFSPTPTQPLQLPPKAPRQPFHHSPRSSQTILAAPGKLWTRSPPPRRCTLPLPENCFDAFVMKGGRGNRSPRNEAG